MTNRREFIVNLSLGSGALLSASALNLAHAQAAAPAALPMLPETDPQAVALGYKADTTKVDKAKYPKHAATQLCNNCSLYQGKPADKGAGCPLFAGKQVAGKGWCSAWVKKA